MTKLRRSYTEYPPRFFESVESFLSSLSPLEFSLPARDAYTTRNRFYFFFESLRRGLSENPSDRYLAALVDLARDLSLRILPPSARGDTPTKLILYLHPLSKLHENGPPGIPPLFESPHSLSLESPPPGILPKEERKEEKESPENSIEAIEEFFLKGRGKREKDEGNE